MLGKSAALMVACLAVVAGCTSPTDTRRQGPGDDGNATGPPGTGSGHQTGNQTGNNTSPTIGGNLTTPAGNTSFGAGSTTDVQMLDSVYQPDNVQVNVTDTVRFTNLGAAQHSVTIRKDGTLLEMTNQTVAPGEDASVTFAEAGVYLLRCVYHSTDYDTAGQMIGRITVV